MSEQFQIPFPHTFTVDADDSPMTEWIYGCSCGKRRIYAHEIYNHLRGHGITDERDLLYLTEAARNLKLAHDRIQRQRLKEKTLVTLPSTTNRT